MLCKQYICNIPFSLNIPADPLFSGQGEVITVLLSVFAPVIIMNY